MFCSLKIGHYVFYTKQTLNNQNTGEEQPLTSLTPLAMGQSHQNETALGAPSNQKDVDFCEVPQINRYVPFMSRTNRVQWETNHVYKYSRYNLGIQSFNSNVL